LRVYRIFKRIWKASLIECLVLMGREWDLKIAFWLWAVLVIAGNYDKNQNAGKKREDELQKFFVQSNSFNYSGAPAPVIGSS
jgi:hypothetical protein